MTRQRLLFLILASLVVLSTVVFLVSMMTMRSYSSDSVNNELVPDAKQFSSTKDGAYVFLALGAQTIQMNCPAAIESLVRHAGWNGKVYLVTDKYSCYDKQEIIENAGMQKENFNIIKIDEDLGSGGVDILNPKIGSRMNRMRSFARKTQLFQFINDTSVQVIAYADCDVLFGIEGCATKFIGNGSNWKKDEEKIKFSQITRNPLNNETDMIHSGTIVMHREHSKHILKRWNTEVLSGLYDRDCRSYMGAFNKLKKQNLSVNPMEPEVIQVPSEVREQYGDRFEKFYEADQKQVYCVNHISKARCKLYGRNQVQKFVDRFRLKTYKDNVNYCTHPLLNPLLYGWFPIDWLPKCAKFETYLR